MLEIVEGSPDVAAGPPDVAEFVESGVRLSEVNAWSDVTAGSVEGAAVFVEEDVASLSEVNDSLEATPELEELPEFEGLPESDAEETGCGAVAASSLSPVRSGGELSDAAAVLVGSLLSDGRVVVLEEPPVSPVDCGFMPSLGGPAEFVMSLVADEPPSKGSAGLATSVSSPLSEVEFVQPRARRPGRNTRAMKRDTQTPRGE